MDLPPYPDASEPCVITTPYVLVAVCVNGQRVLAWALVSEIFNENTPSLRAGSPCGGSCPKTAAIETAREMKWSADELVKVLKALGG